MAKLPDASSSWMISPVNDKVRPLAGRRALIEEWSKGRRRRRPVSCSLCGQAGHNKRACPSTQPPEFEPEEAKAEPAIAAVLTSQTSTERRTTT